MEPMNDSSADVRAGAFALRCGVLFDGTGAAPRYDEVVTVRAGRITSGDDGAALPVVDLSDCFVMPGLVDAHAHVSTYPILLADWPREPGLVERALSVPGNLRSNLLAGTTTMRVMGEADGIDVDARAGVVAGELQGPNMLIATRALGEDRFRALGVRDDVDGVRQMAREDLDAGADFIKIHLTQGAEGGREPLFSPAAIAAVVEEARRRGTYVAAHAHGGPAIRTAIDAGVRSIEHAFDISDDDIDAMTAAGTWLVSTLAFDFEPNGLESVIDRLGPGYGLSGLRAERRNITERMKAAIAGGVRIAFGTNHLPGAMAAEIRLAVGLGMPVGVALTAATSGGAQLLGVDKLTGSIEPGKNADFVAFGGDPFVELDALNDVVALIKDGKVLVNARRPQ